MPKMALYFGEQLWAVMNGDQVIDAQTVETTVDRVIDAHAVEIVTGH